MGTTKIEGLAMMHGPDDSDPMFLKGDEIPPMEPGEQDDWLFYPSLLLISDGDTPPKVWTQEEVKAIVKEMFAAHFDPGHFTPRHREEKVVGQPFEETIPQWSERAKTIIAAKHGINLSEP